MYRINIGAFIVFGIAFVSALLISGTFFYGIFFFLLFLLLFSGYMGRKIYTSMECLVWKASEKTTTGSVVEYSVEIYNSSFFPIPYIEIYLNIPQRLTGEEEKYAVRSLIPGGKTKITRKFTCRHKGIYDLGFIEVVYSDPFLIFSWRKKYKYDICLTVYPRIHPLQNIIIPANQLFGTISKRNNAFEDFTSIKDIRKYNEGDSLKKIHWKVSAHKGDLYVKNLDMNASTHMNLFLDLYEEKYKGSRGEDIEEISAQWAASLIAYAMSKGIGINLYAVEEEYINLSNKENKILDSYLEVLARLRPKGKINISQLIHKEAQKLNTGVTIIVITPKVDDSLIYAATQLKAKGFQFIFLEIEEYWEEVEKGKTSTADGVKCVSIPLDEEVWKYMRDKYGQI